MAARFRLFLILLAGVTVCSTQIYARSQDIDGAALEFISGEVESLVARDNIVGGELLVIQHGVTVFRSSYGWKDREQQKEMSVGALYSVRSMTKPLVGTVAQMLVDEDVLSLSTRIAEILPEFDSPGLSDISVEHLLTHTSGLPMSTIRGPLSGYEDLRAVAREAAQAQLAFTPGEKFQYSDAGTDVLGAVLEQVSGRSLSSLVIDRILQPLEMKNSFTLLEHAREHRGDVPVAYSGGTGSWARHWGPGDDPIFTLFLGSQGLYSTTRDYARFLQAWLDRYLGRNVTGFTLSEAALRRALAPVSPVPAYPALGNGITAHYGQLWLVHATSSAEDRRIIRFGHDGSDGTYGWVWPVQELIFLFFTQSRGTRAGLQVEALVQRHLVDGEPITERPSTVRSSRSIEGLYWDEDVAHAVYDVTLVDDRLELDRPGGMHMVFRPTEDSDRFVAEANDDLWVRFVRDEAGDVAVMETFFGKRTETDPRHMPDASLPDIQEVIERVVQAHQVDQLQSIPALEMRGSLTFVDKGMSGSFISIFDAKRSRQEVAMGGAQETVWTDGVRAWTRSPYAGLTELSGGLLEQVLMDHPVVQFGDWNSFFSIVRALKRVTLDDRPTLLVHAKTTEGRSNVFYVDEETGRLLRRDALQQIPGIGIVGVQTVYEEYQAMEGVILPSRTTSLYVTDFMGRVRTQLDTLKPVEVDDSVFTPDGL